MERTSALVVACLCACLGSGSASAQGFDEGLEVAQAEIDAKHWKEALELLLPWQEKAALEGDLEVLAAKLEEVCAGLVGETGLESALRACSAALAVRKRLYGDRDEPHVAQSLNSVAYCLQSLGRAGEALPQYEAALAMWKRLYGDRDHPHLATSLNNVAYSLKSLGRAGEALSQFESALAMRKRLYGDRDHPEAAQSLNNVAYCLQSLGRTGEALPQFESALAIRQRLYANRDHPEMATSLNNLAGCLEALGRVGEALPQYESALAMWERLYGERDHPDVATGLNNVAYCLLSLGRAGQALPQCESALAMRKRLYGDRDHPDVAVDLNNVATCLRSLGRAGEALPQYESALAMTKRLYGDRDHPEVAASLNNVAACLIALDRAGEALPQYESALAMRKRLWGDRDHPDVALGLNNVAACLIALDRAGEALPQNQSALAMWKRLYGDRDHRDVAMGLNNVAACLEPLGKREEAVSSVAQAVAMVERLRDDTRTSSELRQSLFDDLKSWGSFERLQRLAGLLGRTPEALHAAERSRGRELLDMVAQLGDPDAEAQRRARLRGDGVAASRLAALSAEIESARTDSDRLLHELTRLADLSDDGERDKRRAALLAQSDEVSTRLRQRLDERARLLGDVLPLGRVRTPAEIQTGLRKDELLLEFTVTKDVALLYVVAREGEIQAIELPTAFATAQRVLPTLLQKSSREQLRGRDPGRNASAASAAASVELFASLIPATVWERVRGQKRVFVAAHRALHRMPFELLVTDVKDGKPVHWLDSGPPVSYVPSGTLLHWLRERSKEASDDTTSLDLLAVGDPRRLDAEPEVPEQGVFVVAVSDGGEGARVGLQPGDVLTSYDGTPLENDKELRDARMATERAIEDGQREKKPIPVGVWRRGGARTVEVQPGLLGIQVGPGRARAAHEAGLGSDAKMERITRAGDLERIGRLPPLLGARAEVEAIAAAFRGKEARAEQLLGDKATEPAVFDLAAKAKYLHFACHCIAEEYAGQSLSMVVLALPPRVQPGDDGLLKLGDFFNSWRGRLSSCRLVVLAACRTNVGDTGRDETPQALPIGFLFAGAPAVISSLWAVDDASTKELMTDFYGRLLAGETDRLAAFTAARKVLRAKYPDPFHWAPFLYMGAPE